MEEDKQNPEHRNNKVRRRQAAGSSSDSSHVEVSVDDVMDKKGLTAATLKTRGRVSRLRGSSAHSLVPHHIWRKEM
ncbi:hypothetical protein ABVT39_013681 [Epinephelus coioides]